MIVPSRLQSLSQLDDASNSQPADPTIQGSPRSGLPSDTPPNGPTTTGNKASPHLLAEHHAASEYTAMNDQESWTVVQNRKLLRSKPPTSPQPQTSFETIMLRPKAFNITQIPPYQFTYILYLSLPQIKGSDILCILLPKSNLAAVDYYTEQAAHLLPNLEHLIIDDQIVQFTTYVALREGRTRGVIHRIKELTEEQLMQGPTSSTHEIVSARPLRSSNIPLITFNGSNLPEYVAFESEVDVLIAGLQSYCHQQLVSMQQLNLQLAQLPKLQQGVQDLMNTIGELEGMFEEVELRLVSLEDVIETQALQEKQLDERFKLALYGERKKGHFESLKVMATPKKRQNYDAKNLATKVEILEALKNGESRQQVMTKYNVKRSTLGTYVKN
ncbi:hypothetical protein HPB51_025498 [Rhipicephalus microplus]|uniref:Uncharacterized protein n=1 Tax=Rhipicephalus microplus TaxID=6941 RepID=A0A9J6DDM0_RHIMP|nr:hypothetical protein HPB51_025498 [Rhipicephalus microplus]